MSDILIISVPTVICTFKKVKFHSGFELHFLKQYLHTTTITDFHNTYL